MNNTTKRKYKKLLKLKKNRNLNKTRQNKNMPRLNPGQRRLLREAVRKTTGSEQELAKKFGVAPSTITYYRRTIFGVSASKGQKTPNTEFRIRHFGPEFKRLFALFQKQYANAPPKERTTRAKALQAEIHETLAEVRRGRVRVGKRLVQRNPGSLIKLRELLAEAEALEVNLLPEPKN